MVGQTTPLNSVQKTLPNVSTIGTSTTVGTTPAVVYTCPTGKRALILSMSWALIATGTGTKANSTINGKQGRQAVAIDTNGTPVQDPAVPPQGMLITAGQTIAFAGDAAGNNETVNYFISIQESDA